MRSRRNQSAGQPSLQELAASEAATAANAAKTDLVARADQLRMKLESLRLPAQLEQQSQGDDGMIIPGVRNIKLFAIVASTILTIALPPAAAGTGALIATTLAPQLLDLLLGKGSQTEQDLEDLVKSGTALGQKLTRYLKDLEGTAAGLKQYADLYEASFKASGNPDTALEELKKRLKKDFGSDAAAAKRFALDFKKLRADLVSVKAGPNSPKQTAFLEVARELASVAQQAQQAIFTARQSELARQVASARRNEAVDHGAALVTLKGTVNQEGFALRKATEETLRRAQKTVSLLASFQFRAGARPRTSIRSRRSAAMPGMRKARSRRWSDTTMLMSARPSGRLCGKQGERPRASQYTAGRTQLDLRSARGDAERTRNAAQLPPGARRAFRRNR